jgi:2,4-dienoyl-CoA reductase-like NADH-dependent reductase (Old Yellow Enzyme family)
MFLGDNPVNGEKITTRGSLREAFFLEFAQTVRQRFPDITLMVTGGFRTRRGMEAALTSNACDLVGIARPAAVVPHLPKDLILNYDVSDEEAQINLARVKVPWLAKMIPLNVRLVGIGVESVSFHRSPTV